MKTIVQAIILSVVTISTFWYLEWHRYSDGLGKSTIPKVYEKYSKPHKREHQETEPMILPPRTYLMPGTPTAMPWWGGHTVGNKGYTSGSGAPAGNTSLNATILTDLNMGSGTNSATFEFILTPPTCIWTFNVTNPYDSGTHAVKLQLNEGILYKSLANEAACLAAMRDGITATTGSWNHDPFAFDFNNPEWSGYSQVWLGTCLDASCGGEPHFVGFDKSQFDFQGISGSWYNLMKCPALEVVAQFKELYPEVPVPEGTTFMTKMKVRIGDDWFTFIVEDFPVSPRPIPREQLLNLDRGLVQSLQTISGEPVGAFTRKFDGGEIVVTCLKHSDVKFMNMSIRLIDLQPTDVNGILGQTLQPMMFRVPNEEYEVSWPKETHPD